MTKDNFDFENETPETSGKKFSDLDLGLDFDLSFLDDVDESVLEEVPEIEEAPAKEPKAAPAAEAETAGVNSWRAALEKAMREAGNNGNT